MNPPAQHSVQPPLPRAPFEEYGGGIARNSLWLLGASFSPYLIAVLAVPVLLARLGPAQFGALTLCWAGLNYLSVLDFGIGRALTRLAAGEVALPNGEPLVSVFRSSLLLTACVGLVVALSLGLCADLLVDRVLALTGSAKDHAIWLVRAIAVAAPFVISTPVARSMLEARHRFRYVSVVSASTGTINFLGPMLIVAYRPDLRSVVAVLLAGRIATWAMYLWGSMACLPGVRSSDRLRPMAAWPLLAYGGWVTVSNFVSPVMSYVDRFFVGALISSAAVAYYATPSEIVARALIVAGGFGVVLFPNFSMHVGDSDRLHRLFCRAVKFIAVTMIGVALALIGAGHEVLRLWLGQGFAEHAAPVLEILALGMVVNGIAQVPYALLHATGRPDVTARLHLVELPIYLMAVYWLTPRFGIEGTACAWVARVGVDGLLMLGVAARMAKVTAQQVRTAVVVAAIGLVGLAAVAVTGSPGYRLAFALALGFLGLGATWRWLFLPDDRLSFARLISRGENLA